MAAFLSCCNLQLSNRADLKNVKLKVRNTGYSVYAVSITSQIEGCPLPTLYIVYNQ